MVVTSNISCLVWTTLYTVEKKNVPLISHTCIKKIVFNKTAKHSYAERGLFFSYQVSSACTTSNLLVRRLIGMYNVSSAYSTSHLLLRRLICLYGVISACTTSHVLVRSLIWIHNVSSSNLFNSTTIRQKHFDLKKIAYGPMTFLQNERLSTAEREDEVLLNIQTKSVIF